MNDFLFLYLLQSSPSKTKVKKKTLPKKSVVATKKAITIGKDESNKLTHKKLKASPNKVKAKSTVTKVTKVKRNDNNDNSSNSDTDHDAKTIDRKPVVKKIKKATTIRKPVAVTKTTDVKENVVRKRMASLNASAMMAATYEVERQLDKCEEKMFKMSTDTTVDHPVIPPKKPKEIKNEVLEPKDVRNFFFPLHFFF